MSVKIRHEAVAAPSAKRNVKIIPGPQFSLDPDADDFKRLFKVIGVFHFDMREEQRG